MTAKDWTLMVIAAGKGKALQPVHLQKALFLSDRLLTNEQKAVDRFYRFDPYDYGPFCGMVYADADSLALDGLIKIEQRPNTSYREYSITAQGMEKAESLRKNIKPEISAYLDKLVGWVMSLSFNQLVSWIYKNFPDMKVNSVFREG